MCFEHKQMEISSEQFEIYTTGGIRLSATCVEPAGDSKGVVFIVHGLGEHQGRYVELIEKFNIAGLVVFTFDHRGHGRSEGKKGHALSVWQYIEDMEHVLMKCRSLFLDLPIFMFGHSMGGQVVATWLNRVKSKEVNGAILSSPWFELVNPPAPWKITVSTRLSGIFPSVTVSNEIDPVHISGIEEEVRKYTSDPFVHDRISFSSFASLFRNGKELPEHTEPCTMPVLVCHGDRDRITSPEASRRYAERLGKNANFKLWSGSHHESHHDFEKEKVMDFYVDWVLKQLD